MNTVTILNGGEEITITRRNGVVEQAKVLLVSQRNMPKLAVAWGNQPKEIEVYLGWEPGTLDALADKPEDLSDESWEAVIEKGRSLNEGPFGRWYGRQTAALKAVKAEIPNPTLS